MKKSYFLRHEVERFLWKIPFSLHYSFKIFLSGPSFLLWFLYIMFFIHSLYSSYLSVFMPKCSATFIFLKYGHKLWYIYVFMCFRPSTWRTLLVFVEWIAWISFIFLFFENMRHVSKFVWIIKMNICIYIYTYAYVSIPVDANLYLNFVAIFTK